jgi:hypothetical protein
MHLVGVLAQDLQPGLLETFRDELRNLGYVEGSSISIEVRNAGGMNDRLPALANELLRLGANVILAINTPAAKAAKNATKNVPIVIMPCNIVLWLDPHAVMTALERRLKAQLLGDVEFDGVTRGATPTTPGMGAPNARGRHRFRPTTIQHQHFYFDLSSRWLFQLQPDPEYPQAVPTSDHDTDSAMTATEFLKECIRIGAQSEPVHRNAHANARPMTM